NLISSNFSFFFSSRRRHTRWPRDWSSDVCSSDLFRTLAFCHVANGASDVKSLGCPQWAQTDLSRKLSLIFASSVKVQVAPHRTHALLGKERCAILQVRAAESGWNQNLDSLPDQFLTTVPE